MAGRGRPPGSQVIVRGGEGSESFSEEKKKFHHPIYLEKERERKKDTRQNSILLLSLALLTNIGTTSGGFFFLFFSTVAWTERVVNMKVERGRKRKKDEKESKMAMKRGKDVKGNGK